MNHVVTLTGSALTYDISGTLTRVSSLEVYNEGPDILYYGDIPPAGTVSVFAAEMLTTVITSGSNIIKLGRDAPCALEQGMVLTAGGMYALFPVGSYVQAINDNQIVMSAVATGSDSGVDGTFTPPALSSSNGMPIQPGETRMFTAALGNALANRPTRFLAASGATCTVRFRKSMN